MIMLMPTLDRNKRRLLVSGLYVLLQIIQISQIECVNNRSNHHYASNDGPPRFYANHRMLLSQDEHRMEARPQAANNHTTLIHIDNTADSSMPRPQLALQIFTSSPSASSDHRSDHHHHHHHQQQQQPVNSTFSNHQQSAKLLNTLLLMPVSSLLRNQRQLDGHLDGQAGGTSSASQRNYMIDLGSQQSKPSQWHYVTESQQSAADLHSSKEKTSTAAAAEAENGAGTGSSSPPLINAIITVPSQSEHHHHEEHDGGHISSHQGQVSDNSTAAQLVDRTIAQLLDGQSTGNLEFSMDLNGEEIVINPVRKYGRLVESANSTRDLLLSRISKLDALSPPDVDGQEDPIQVALSDRRLKTLFDSDGNRSSTHRRHSRESLESQQSSASEIDVIDENNNDDDGDSGGDEGLIESSSKTSRRSNSDRGQDAIVEERNPLTNLEGSLEEGGDTLGEERTQPLDSEPSRALGPSPRKGRPRSRTASGRKQQSRDSGVKLAQASRRRVALKSDDSLDSNEQLVINRRDAKQVPATRGDPSLSAVMIKGDDLKRLEQLLQSLRSASMAEVPNQNQNQKQKQKQRTTNSPSQRRDYPIEEGTTGGSFKREETESRSTHQAEGETWDDQDKNRQPARSSQSDAKTNKNELITLSDCDRRKQQQQKQWRRVANNDDDNGSYESDSSQEPVSESNDDGAEKEEQGSDNYNSVSLPVREQEAREQPRSLFVRKTILQSYYDDNLRQPVVDRQVDRDAGSSSSSSFGSNDELMISRDQRGEQANNQVKPQLIRGYPGGKLMRGQDSSRSENYIDYSKLDDRDVYRGLPSAAGNRTYQGHH